MAGKASRVEKLKEEGNSLFAKKDYRAAIVKYNEAINLDDRNPVLYANRAACRIGLKQYLDAASDASTATEIDPTYAKAWARLATARDGLKEPIESVHAWQKAIDNLPKDGLTEAEKKQKRQYEVSLAEARRAETHFKDKNKPFDHHKVFPVDTQTNKFPWQVADAMIPQLQQAGNYRSSAWTIAWANLQLEEANKVIMSHSALGAIQSLTNAITTDMRVFRLHHVNWFKELAVQMYMEARARNATQWIHASPEKIKKEALERLEANGWNDVRPALSCVVRSLIAYGFLDGGARHNFRSESQYIGRAIEIIKWGRKEWADIDREDRGAIFVETFLRGVQTLHMESLIKLHASESEPARKAETLEELHAEAEELIKSVESDTLPPYESDPPITIGHYDYPRGQGYAMKGYYYNEKSKVTRDKTEKAECYRKSAFLYLDAAGMFPEDDERNAYYLEVALENMMKAATPVTFILSTMEKLRTAIPKMLPLWAMSTLAMEGRDRDIAKTLEWERHFRRQLAEGRLSEEYAASYMDRECPYTPSAFKVDMDFS
ncbi:hypothetical protein VNI00_004159 [Paramarasmius palmivorus]|uniref:TPR-like protein n=1 Tax=Paramarasmius palmivorus TaxID=297713 RepID=A0AAW0DPY4_9AGAR